MITRSRQCHNNPVLVPPRKPLDLVTGLYDSHIYDLKTRVDIWTRINVAPVEYGTFAQTFHLTIWFFQFITGMTFKWDYFNRAKCCSDDMDFSLDQIENL